MPSVASTIFKIRANKDFVTVKSDDNRNILSFRKGQPFYALSADYEKGLYFVSTQYAVPFSRTAVTGLVPIEYFDKVDLLSKDPPISRKKVALVQKPSLSTLSITNSKSVSANTNATLVSRTSSNTSSKSSSNALLASIASNASVASLKSNKSASNASNTNNVNASNKQGTATHSQVQESVPAPVIPIRKQSLTITDDPSSLSLITSLKVVSISQDKPPGSESFCIRIIRKGPTLLANCTSASITYTINRSISDFNTLSAAVGKYYKKIIPSRESKIKDMEIFLSKVALNLLPSLDPSVDAKKELYHACITFFDQNQEELQILGQTATLRRDSGTDPDDHGSNHIDCKQNNSNAAIPTTMESKPQNPFASLSKKVFKSSSNPARASYCI